MSYIDKFDKLQDPGVDTSNEPGIELMRRPDEDRFKAVAPIMVAHGWSVFPQTVDRKPGKVYGYGIRWKEEYDLANRRPDADTLETFCNHCPNLNVACVFGPASGNTFSVDIDCEDPELSRAVQMLAIEILGNTPFQRVGRDPKIALIYRHAPDDKVDSASKLFTATQEYKNGLEILSEGKLLTVWGIHHKTQDYFKWLPFGPKFETYSPATHSPEVATLVTSGQVKAFMAAADERWKFEKAFSGGGKLDVSTWDNVDGIKVPHIGDNAEIKRDAAGKICEGRLSYLKALVTRTIKYGNPVAFYKAKEEGDEAVKVFSNKVAVSVAAKFMETAALDRKWFERKVKTETLGLTAYFMALALNGEMHVPVPNRRQETEARNRPEIFETTDMHTTADECEDAMIASGSIFKMGNQVVTVQEPPKRKGVRDSQQKRIHPKDEWSLMDTLCQVASFKRESDKGEIVGAKPSKDLRKVLLSRGFSLRLPELVGMVRNPTIREDGSILSEQGYDDKSGLFVDLSQEFSEIPEKPSKQEAEEARDTLFSAIKSFKFVSRQDRAVGMSGMMTACVRKSLPQAPMHAVTANAPGSGKTTLAHVFGVLAQGAKCTPLKQATNDDAMEKILGPALESSVPVILIDNCTHPLGGASLNVCLTEPTFGWRRLGVSELVESPTCAMFVATGNNLAVHEDMVRRVLPCRLDAGVERPELIEHTSDPVEYAKANRGKLVVASLTLIKAYEAAGRPRQTGPVASYKEWSTWIRDALMWVGEADAAMAMDVGRESDPHLGSINSVFAQWHLIAGNRKLSARELIDLAEESTVPGGYVRRNPDLHEALLEVGSINGSAINGKKLGRWLAQNANRIVSGYKIERLPQHLGIQRWQIVRADGAEVETTIVNPAGSKDVDSDLEKTLW